MALGIFYAILSGLSWIAVGAVVGLAEKRGCGSTRQQLVSNALSGTISVLVLGAGLLLRPDADAFALRCDWPSALWMLLCGYLNFWMVVYMGKAMLRGPNGIVWTIVQSGFIFSFTLGVVWDPAFENLIKGQTICFPALRLTRNCPIFNLVLTWVNHYGVIFTLLARRRRLSRQGRVC